MNTLIVNGSGAIGSAIVNELSDSDANLIITSSSGEKVHGHDSIRSVSYTHLTLPTKRIV